MKYLPLLLFPLLMACNESLTPGEITHYDSSIKAHQLQQAGEAEYNSALALEDSLRPIVLRYQAAPNLQDAYRIIDSTIDARYAPSSPAWYAKLQEHRQRRDSIARAEGFIK